MEEKIYVKNHIREGSKPTRMYEQVINKILKFGRELKITPKANTTINDPGFKIEFFVETVNVTIGIGKDHTADLIMTKEAWEAFRSGEEVHITTTKEFKEKYLN